MKYRSFFKKITFFIIPLILLIILKNFLFTTQSLLAGIHDVNQLKSKLETRKKDNEYLSQRIYFVKENEFIEQEARKKLGLVKPDEVVVITKKPQGAPILPIQEQKEPWQKWLDLFL